MNSKLIGRWRIIKSEEWAPDMMDMDQPAKVEINKDGFGFLNFCAVEADIDYRISDNEKDKIEFSFSGQDDGDPISGRGWAKLEGEKLIFEIYFHRGMESWFEAKKI